MNYTFKIQYPATEILDRAKKYLEKREANGKTGEEEDRLAMEAGSRLVHGPFDIEDAKTVVRWRKDLLELNSPDEVEAAIKDAIAATNDGDVKRAVKALMKLKGVGLKMASAFLTVMFPTIYTVCDIRASQALGQKDYGSLRYYVAYLDYCQRTARQLGVSLRDFDRANWQWSWEQSQKVRSTTSRKRRCPKPSTVSAVTQAAVAA